MNKFKYYFILLLAGIAVVSCNKDDDNDVEVVPLRDYKVQYKADNDSIVKYLKTNYIEVDKTTFDVKITKIKAGGTQLSIWDQKEYELKIRKVYSNDVNYEVYYLVLREGTGASPCNYDKISASYTGNVLTTSEYFDTSYGVARTFSLEPYLNTSVIEGWSEIFPQFKTGTSTTAENGVITYDNYGAGVMFLPSGLGYYANTQDKIPAYSPLVFSFKLFSLQRLDHDFDGVFDFEEDLNHDGYLYDFRNTAKYPNPPKDLVSIDDTDKDGVADFIDVDDDGDGYTTFFEITKPTGAPKTGLSTYYPYNPVLDNPNTPNVDETETYGIPEFAATGEPDYTSPGRKRIHVDKAHHTAKP
ncbi:MAG: hypothetical protein EOO44_06460 [Flavobacterium sp.]|nr:MAG: hypothetical protein EOO44_06460 [Flavobacterium sp.]